MEFGFADSATKLPSSRISRACLNRSLRKTECVARSVPFIIILGGCQNLCFNNNRNIRPGVLRVTLFLAWLIFLYLKIRLNGNYNAIE